MKYYKGIYFRSNCLGWFACYRIQFLTDLFKDPFLSSVCVITNGFSSVYCACTILKSRGQRCPCHFLCQRSWVTCGKDIGQGRLIYVPAIVSTCFNCWLSVFVYELCVVSSIANPCPLKIYCQATQEIRRRLWHHSHFLLTITPQCVLGVWPDLVAPSVGFDQSKSHERAFSRIQSGVWISEAVCTSSAFQASYDEVKILHCKIQSKQP